MYMVDKSTDKPPLNVWIWQINLSNNNVMKNVNGLHACWQIIASTDPSLGLPLLPPIEEKIDYKGFNEVWIKFIHSIPPLNRTNVVQFTDEAKNIWKEGYKAAKAKRYSEEDLEKALVMKNMGYGKEFIIQSLNPLPKQVEVEMEDFCDYEGEELWEITPDWRLKLKNNIIQVIRWIYEKD